jgi:hypothetical protein
VDFTREPIIETVITPREGYRLVVRSSKNVAQEEHFVEALEVVSFGTALFFRCRERPKPFIVPVGDYEILEVREAKMVLKTPSFEKTATALREPSQRPKHEQRVEAKPEATQESEKKEAEFPSEGQPLEARSDRRRDRRRSFRRRRGQAREEVSETSVQQPTLEISQSEKKAEETLRTEEEQKEKILSTTPLLSTILPPPTTLIREHLEVLRKQPAYKDAFYRESGSDFAEDEDTLLEQLRSGDEKKEFEVGDQEVSQHEPFRSTYGEETTSEFFERDKIVDSTDLEPKIP